MYVKFAVVALQHEGQHSDFQQTWLKADILNFSEVAGVKNTAKQQYNLQGEDVENIGGWSTKISVSRSIKYENVAP